MEKQILDNVEKAKKIAEEDYHLSMEKINCANRSYIREWKAWKLDDGRVIFGLSGSPDKAFVVIENDYSVTARRGDLSIIQTFKENDE